VQRGVSNDGSDSCTKGCSSNALCPPPPQRQVQTSSSLIPNELLLYLEEHKKIVVELTEAVREVSALLREMIFLLAAPDRQKHYQ
jgi:hypothetical protein